MKHTSNTTTKTTTTTNKESMKLETIRTITPVPIIMKIEVIVQPSTDNERVVDTISIPFVAQHSGKGFKAGENVLRDDKGEVLKVNQLEYNEKEGVIKFVPSDDGFNRLNKIARSEWAKDNAYIGLRTKNNNMLIQGISNNIRIGVCVPHPQIELSGEKLRDAILNHTPTKLLKESVKSGAKDSIHKTSDVLDSIG